MSVTQRMRVQKYLPNRLFGFAGVGDAQVFFHLGIFQPGREHPPRCSKCEGCSWAVTPPPPVLGEEVDVTFEPTPGTTRAPSATRVVRVTPPVVTEGRVEVFDAQRGYGFIAGKDGQSHYLHASEVLEGKTPVIGTTVRFFVGTRQGKPRACHVRICR